MRIEESCADTVTRLQHHTYTGVLRAWQLLKSGGCTKERIRFLHGDAGRADRTGRRALVMGRASKEVRSKKTRAFVSTGIRCAAGAWDGQLSPADGHWGAACAMSNHDSCDSAGMLLPPHSTHLHPSSVCARLAGAFTTSVRLIHACAGGACEAWRQQWHCSA